LTRHEVSEADSEFFLEDLVSEGKLLFQMKYVVVSLFDMEFGPILFSLEIDLLHVQKMLVVLDIDLLDLLLEHLRLVVFDKFVSLGFHIREVLA
jgi:hypothetical protein